MYSDIYIYMDPIYKTWNKVSGETIYLFANVNDCTVDIWEWICNIIDERDPGVLTNKRTIHHRILFPVDNYQIEFHQEYAMWNMSSRPDRL